jgi:hypothetical protein
MKPETKKHFKDAGLTKEEIEQMDNEDIYDSVYMDVVRLVEIDNTSAAYYKETAKKLKAKYEIKLRKQ